MQISSRFTIAIHMLLCMEAFGEEYKVTSSFLASSIQVNPVVIRKIFSQLADAGLIVVRRGPGGAVLGRPPEQITFLEIYRAVECVEEETLFHFHERPNPACPVGKNVHRVLDGRLLQVQAAMERELSSITLADVFRDLRACLNEP